VAVNCLISLVLLFVQLVLASLFLCWSSSGGERGGCLIDLTGSTVAAAAVEGAVAAGAAVAACEGEGGQAGLGAGCAAGTVVG